MNARKFGYFDKTASPASCSGETFVPRMQLVRDGNNLALIDTGEKIDLQAHIKSFEDSVSLPRMIARFQAGDADVFSGDSGFYGDVSEMPTSLQDLIERSRANYAALNAALRAKVGAKQKEVKDAAAAAATEKKESEVKSDAGSQA